MIINKEKNDSTWYLKHLSENYAKKICDKCKEILLLESNIKSVYCPVVVIGDIHGQIYDLIKCFKISGTMPNSNFLLLGDYVDRGFYSVETIIMITEIKIKYPHKMTIIRGNHESRQITQVYGFYDECFRKYGNIRVWQIFTDLFDCLPIAAIIENKIFCVHAGLSPALKKLDDLRKLHRFEEVPQKGIICDLLWSDPDEIYGWSDSPRSAGYTFGKNITKHFNRVNAMKFIARGHQLVSKGFKWHHDGGVITVFSAPNYCYRCGNLAAILEIDESLNQTVIQFKQTDPEFSSD
jgi:serine/threonine-protein phosphatase 2A catalytic subunit